MILIAFNRKSPAIGLILILFNLIVAKIRRLVLIIWLLTTIPRLKQMAIRRMMVIFKRMFPTTCPIVSIFRLLVSIFSLLVAVFRLIVLIISQMVVIIRQIIGDIPGRFCSVPEIFSRSATSKFACSRDSCE